MTVSMPLLDELPEILLQDGCVGREEMEKAVEEQKLTGGRIDQILVKNGYVTEKTLMASVAAHLNIPPVDLSKFRPAPDVLELVSRQVASFYKVIPLAKIGNTLTLAMVDPLNVLALDDIRLIAGLDIQPAICAGKEFRDALENFYSSKANMEHLLKDAVGVGVEAKKKESEQDINLDELVEQTGQVSIIKIVNMMLVQAIKERASDIHIEPFEKEMKLRYRVDGVLHESVAPPKHMQNAVTSRIKIMSNLDIAERRIPQDGRFRIRALGKEVDIRLSILPCVHGEKIVMRTLDKTSLAPSLAALNLEKTAYENLMFGISQPHGLILVTGPTGSGKTTTLYSALQELNTTDVNIITVEDPVEYQLAGINQVQTQASVGLTFAAALRSILRQDPDIVLVGETRDGETAAIAIQAALTGHLVLTTLHTNDAAGAVSRLLYMGIEPFMLASSLIMAQAQRLYRKLCPVCKQPIDIPTETLRLNHLDPAKFEGVQFFYHKGCPKCGNIGYKGRGAVMEILMVNDHIRKLILDNADSAAVRTQAVSDGMRTLLDVGLDRVRDGLTSIEEALSVAGGE